MTQMPSYRQLRRSQTNRKISGVCGGVAEYFGVDPTLVRVAFLAISVLTGGAFLLAYLFALVVMPDGPQQVPVYNYPPSDIPPN